MVRKLVLSLIVILACGASALAQNRQVTGTVSDTNGTPIPGATVLVEGTITGTTTGADGTFSVSAPANGTLLVSFLGYKDLEVAIDGRTNVAVTLEDDAQTIDDVIVVAFGTAKKAAFTGSAAVIQSEDIAKVQSTSATRALEGMVAGVQMTTSSGNLSSAPSIRIRGISSIAAGSEPLYIVDGTPYSGDLNNINTADIESMSVLKDATSNALYGARGANGVIMITTKRAKSQNAIINVDAKWGINSQALQTYDYIDDPAQYYETHYATLRNYYANALGRSAAEAHALANQNVVSTPSNGGLGYQVFTVPDGQSFIGTNGKVNPNATLGKIVSYQGKDYLITPDDWMDEAYKTGFRQEYNVSVAGNTDRSSVYASFGYLNNKGIIDGSDMYRYTARIRADYQAKEWLRVGANAAYTNYKWHYTNSDEGAPGSTGNIFAATATIAPIYPVYIRDGEGNIMIDQYGMKMYDYGNNNAGLSRSVLSMANPLQAVQLNKNESDGNAFNGTGFAEVKFLKDFRFTFNAGVSLDEARGLDTSNMLYGQFAPTGGTIYRSHGRDFSYNLQQLLNYTKVLADVHTLDVLLGHEYYVRNTYSLSAQKSNMFDPNSTELNQGVVNGTPGSYTTFYNNEGYFGRVQYDYKEKIFASVSYRRDASSRFHPSHRWGNFWSLGAAWLIDQETWFNAPWVDMLKVKASYGSQGNDNIGNYRYTNMFTIENVDDQLGVTPSRTVGTPDITWETNTNFNTGVEFSLWGGRLSGSAEYFNRKTTDMLYFFPAVSHMGVDGSYKNIGDMRNSGVEIDLHAILLNKKNIRWDFSVNATHYKNKVTMIPPDLHATTLKASGYKGYLSGNKILAEGLPLNTFYMKQYAGVDQATGLPLWYMDQTDAENNVTRVTTNNYDLATQYVCDDVTPLLYGGFGTNVSFYGVDVSANFTYSIGGLTYDSGYAASVAPPGDSTGSNWHKDVLNAWTPENHTNFPRMQYQDRNINAASDRFLVDASYLNIQNVQVGYTLPQSFTRKFSVDRLRVYLACDNIFYWSYRKGLDPRYSFSGTTNYANYSPIRTISGGINVTF